MCIARSINHLVSHWVNRNGLMLSDRQIYRPVWPPQIYMYGVFSILCNFKSRPDGSHVLCLSPCNCVGHIWGIIWFAMLESCHPRSGCLPNRISSCNLPPTTSVTSFWQNLNYTNPILSFVLFRLRLVEDGSQQYNLQPTSMEAAYCSFPSGTSSQHVDDFFVETSMPPN